ncbi:MAG: DUF2750 domain-containing protein [Pseudomonadota bacterium]
MKFKNEQDGIDRAKKFYMEVIETRTVYCMYEPRDNLAKFESIKHYDAEDIPLAVFPVWSKTYLPYARHCAICCYGEGLTIKEMSLDEFYRSLLPFAIENGCLLGINWDQLGIGSEVDPKYIYSQIDPHMAPKESKGLFKSLKLFWGTIIIVKIGLILFNLYNNS